MIPGIILCGGASRRMGQSKAEMVFQGESLLLRMIRLLQRECHPIVVAGAPNQQFSNLPVDVLVSKDEIEHCGPVHGLRAAWRALPAECRHAFVVGCDMPLLRSETIRLFLDRLPRNGAVVARIDGVLQPLPAVYPNCWPTDIVPASLKEHLRGLEIAEIPESEFRQFDPTLQSFVPMNTAEEFAAALRRANS